MPVLVGALGTSTLRRSLLELPWLVQLTAEFPAQLLVAWYSTVPAILILNVLLWYVYSRTRFQ